MVEVYIKQGLLARNSALKVKQFLAPAIPYIAMIVGLVIWQNAWVAMCGYHLGIVVIILLTGTDTPLSLLFKSHQIGLPLILAGLGICGGILLYLLWPLLEVPVNISSILQQMGLNSTSWPFFLIYFMAVNPFLEEYYWRGLLRSDIKRPVLNDILFAGYHLFVLAGKMEVYWLVVILFLLTASAWFWRQTNRWCGGLLPSVLCHLSADISVITAIYLMTSRMQ